MDCQDYCEHFRKHGFLSDIYIDDTIAAYTMNMLPQFQDDYPLGMFRMKYNIHVLFIRILL